MGDDGDSLGASGCFGIALGNGKGKAVGNAVGKPLGIGNGSTGAPPSNDSGNGSEVGRANGGGVNGLSVGADEGACGACPASEPRALPLFGPGA